MHIFINTLNCCQLVIILIIKIYNSDLMLQMYVKNFIFFQVLQTAQKEMLNYNNTGISVMGEECFKEQLTKHVFN